ncbi:uncharacterized protein METZ01_LOCUS430220, partial [marine metagenome]
MFSCLIYPVPVSFPVAYAKTTAHTPEAVALWMALKSASPYILFEYVTSCNLPSFLPITDTSITTTS